MLLSTIVTLPAMATLARAWKLKWFSGIGGNCSVAAFAFSDFLVVRVWEGGDDDHYYPSSPSSSSSSSPQQQCVPAVGPLPSPSSLLPSSPAGRGRGRGRGHGHGHAEHHPAPVTCRDYVYDGGELSSTEDCEREIGRGSAVVEGGGEGSGSSSAARCEFYDEGGDDGCEGEPFLGLDEGVCDEQIYFTNFTCTDG